MHIFDLIFWTFFAGTLGFIAWSFLRAIICAIAGRQPGARASHNAAGFGGGESSSDYGTSPSSDVGGTESNGGDSGSGDSNGGGDFSGGGGESGGGGSSGGW